MKTILTILSLLISGVMFGQFPNSHSQSNDKTNEIFKGAVNPIKGLINGIYSDTTAANNDYISKYPLAQIGVGSSLYVRDSTATRWILIGSGSGSVIAGGAITSVPTVGFNPGTGLTSDQFIVNSFYQSQPPTAALTGGVILEFRSAQTMNYTLNWSAGRQSATTPLSSIIVAGITQSFSQPSAGNSVSGTQAVSFPTNTDITYSNVVTTTDGKSATANTTYAFAPQRYFGWINVSDTIGIRVFGYNDSKITSLGSELSYSKAKTWNTGSPSGTQIYVYAYYAPAGILNNLILNGFPSISAFNGIQRQFTNALGFTGNWIIYFNRNGQTLASDIIAN
jgi:hypothetical protein